MFKVVDIIGNVHDAFGTFIDEDGDVQFILCGDDGIFYKTNKVNGYYKLYRERDNLKLCDVNNIFKLLRDASWEDENSGGARMIWLNNTIKTIKDNIK